MSVFIFLLVLSFLVIIHELGHFFFARRFGIKVEEFGMGYPPRARLIGKDKKGTEYSLNWLPFGGFVRLYGEDSSLEKASGAGADAFFKVSVVKRLVVVAAGAVVNFIFGILAFSIIYTVVGIPTNLNKVRVDEVAPESPAEIAGIKAGDTFDAVIAEGTVYELKTVNDFISQITGSFRGQTINLRRADDHGQTLAVYVRLPEETPAQQGAMGVVVTDFEMKRYPAWQMPFRGTAYGLKTAVEFGGVLLGAMGDMVGQLFSGQIPKDVAGPVGIAYMAQKEGMLSGGWMQVLNFAAILSINLAIVNLLPIPALDGGRGAFLIYEGVTKRKVKPEWEQRVNTVGFALLLGLLVLISIKDVTTVLADTNIQDWFKNVGGLVGNFLKFK